MSHRIAAKITGVAGYVPPKVMTNADFEKIVETSDEWIRTRTGIRERHVVEKGMASSHLATEAAKALLAQTKTDPADIDLSWFHGKHSVKIRLQFRRAARQRVRPADYRRGCSLQPQRHGGPRVDHLQPHQRRQFLCVVSARLGR